MLEYLRGLMWEGLNAFLAFFLDMFSWFFERVYELVNDFLQWMLDFFGELVISAITSIIPVLPEGIFDTVVAVYQWLEYIDEWVPIGYGIGLIYAYYQIMLILILIRWLLRLVPGLGG